MTEELLSTNAMVDSMTQEMEKLGVELVSKNTIVASLDTKLESKDIMIDRFKAIITRETELLLSKRNEDQSKIDITSMFDSMMQEMEKLVGEVALKDAIIASRDAKLALKDAELASMVDGIDKLFLASNEAIMEKPDAIDKLLDQGIIALVREKEPSPENNHPPSKR